MVWKHSINVVLLASVLSYCTSSKHHGQNRHRPQMEAEFYGSIAENTFVVELQSTLVAIDKDAPRVPGLICEYELHNLPENAGSEIPFQVNVVDRRTGEGEIVLLPTADLLDCENQTLYSYYITARDCGVGPDGKGDFKAQRRSAR
uniref:Cadherin domain-containing protein n=1 Tax=Ciona savignyi TaxID=51511 RepID=H2YB44_CIOSA